MQDADVSYLSPEYRQLLTDADKVRQQYKEQPQHLDHLMALIKDLYMVSWQGGRHGTVAHSSVHSGMYG